MNTPTNGEFSIEPQASAPLPLSETRPMYWSVRREIWENRSVYLAPLAVAALVLFASMIGTIGLPGKMRNLAALTPAKQHRVLVGPLSIAPAPIMLATFIVGIFFTLDALYGERRDRSILFWKSLPVSDRTTVLSKAAIPLVVLPLIAFVLSVIVQVILLFFRSAVLAASGLSPARMWAEFLFFENLLIMLYGLTVHTLWFAPIYGWLLLVSGWAKRAPVLWALLPLLAVSAVERLALNTWHFMRWLQYRVTGAMTEAFAFNPNPSGHGDVERISQLTPLRFLSAPGLWIGLIFAAAFLAAAVRLRRNREPI